MVKQDLSLQSPLRFLGYKTEGILPNGGFGAILARAGVGKTAFLIQTALDYLIRDKNVLHISLNDPVEKVGLWYEEVFRNMTAKWSRKQAQECWETLLPHRFIMTFRVEGFTVPILDERLTDLSEQGVFFPRVLLIDGFRFDQTSRNILLSLKTLVEKRALGAWFTVRTHRHETPGPDGMPAPLITVSDLFEVIIRLHPVGSEIHVNAIKGGTSITDTPDLLLDPSTLLVKNKE